MSNIKTNLEISIEDESWNKEIQDIQGFFEKYAHRITDNATVSEMLPKEIEVSILLTNDADIHALNREYRGKDKPTNVLSFPQEEDFASIKDIDNCVLLGDVVFSIETIKREVKEQGISFDQHLAHLFVHGILHLLGYRHDTDAEADIMESLEVSILKKNISTTGKEAPYSEINE
jgi:probable rRNA maturation factor